MAMKGKKMDNALDFFNFPRMTTRKAMATQNAKDIRKNGFSRMPIKRFEV